MGFYRKIPVQVEARKFIGGAEWAGPVIDWVLANGGTARWHEERYVDFPPSRPDDMVHVPEHICLDVPMGTLKVTVGDWIVLGPGGFYVVEDATFRSDYESV